ncbi:NAD(P)-dependent alcohol dehydrogenase [Mucilaginibacter sp. KACC 22773]|uniref:NAD(P)-dependent alcohol dehydrogenase n=1 Tax=Mucilaginibacter sp. KACC 22773 TaxID=3025671 RepID=UPI002365E0B7|nr:NAD(P)-dependent alcohol dehydrogenase [Mucilaginibacter sp. KACC 22773]WDF81142.1 NAD(P)-dependent alcohol dehydrogenase [Mucilaginibacter sp. KACC 22773]
MKKIIYEQYGSVDVLHSVYMNKPIPNTNQILVKVKAVSINPIDWKIVMGEVKLMSGRKFPKSIGCDFSGTIESIGQNIQNFTVGDDVFGVINPFKEGALAEYVIVNEKQLAKKPDYLSFAQAAALPTVGLTALQALNTSGKSIKGKEILINGASGGVGMLAIQIAKSQGAIVTAVSSVKGHHLLKKWGSDFIIDYNKEDVAKINKQFDVIIELSAKLSFRQAKKIMKPESNYISVTPSLWNFVHSFSNNIISKKKYKILLMQSDTNSLNELANNILKGADIYISKTYPMSDFKEAYNSIIKHGALGKVVFSIPF